MHRFDLRTAGATLAAVGVGMSAGPLDDARAQAALVAPAGAAACECGVTARYVGTTRSRTMLSEEEWIESRVTVAAGGRTVVTSRLSSRLPRSLAAELTVSFVDSAGRQVPFVGRTYGLPARRATGEAARPTRSRAVAMEYRLGAADHCSVARMQISHRRIPA